MGRGGVAWGADRRAIARALALVLALGACRHVPSAPQPEVARIAQWTRFEVSYDVDTGERAPDDVRIEARFTAPSGRRVLAGGFPDRGRFTTRFLPTERGRYRYEIHADSGQGDVRVAQGAFDAVPGEGRGLVRVSRVDPHQLAFGDGAVFVPLGENRMNVYDRAWNYEELSAPDYIARMARYGMNTIRLFVFTDCEREDAEDGWQPGCIEPELGRFDERSARQFDEIFDAAEAHGIYVILTPYAIGFSPDETWKSWDDNPASTTRGGPAESAEEFFERQDLWPLAERKLRYVLDRWGASPNLLAVDLVNEPEWDGNVAEESWIPWAVHLARWWKEADPYGHLVTVGSVGLHWNVVGDEDAWYGSPVNDIVQWHLYGPHVYEVHALAAEMTRKVQESWGYGKPVLVGEFAWGGEDRSTHDHTHVGLWSAVFSGAGVLAHSAPPFTLDSDLPMTPERAHHFRVLADFLARLDRSRPLRPQEEQPAGPAGLRVWSLGRDDYRALWLHAPKEGYGEPLQGAAVVLQDLAAGTYEVQWFDDVSGEPVGQARVTVVGEGTRLEAPPFVRHVAAIVQPAR